MEISKILFSDHQTFPFPDSPVRRFVYRAGSDRKSLFDLGKPNESKEVPLYLTTEKAVPLKVDDTSSGSKLKVKEFCYFHNPFNLIRFRLKYIASVMINANALYQFKEAEDANYEIGKFILKDLNNGKILFLGVVDSEYLNVQKTAGNAVVIKYRIEELKTALKERKYPVKFYVDNALFTDQKYSKFIPEILKLINLINASPEYRVFFTGDVMSEFFNGFDFPIFASIIELEEFINNCLKNIIVNSPSSVPEFVKLSA